MAAGDQLWRWEAGNGVPPTSAFAPHIRRNNHLVAAFDAAAAESLDFEDIMDRRYTAGATVVVTLIWTSDTATTGNVVWSLQAERHDTAQDLDADGFASAVTATASAPATAGAPVYTNVSMTNAQLDGVAAGEHFRFRVTRAAADAGDTMAGDAHLIAVEGREA